MPLPSISPTTPILIVGPTASGKSALALEIAQRDGGIVVNADALQVYNRWPILSAQPNAQDRTLAPHALYGHVPFDTPYSVGAWLREIKSLLSGPDRLIITGGTGLYFTALTEGLAEIPDTPPAIRAEADQRTLDNLLDELDPQTTARIDTQNRVRVQRAWEVLRATGRPMADWQDNTPPPLLPLTNTHGLVLNAPKDWLTPRIAQRFDLMLNAGALTEARDMLPHWDPTFLSSKAIGARELIAHLRGELPLEAAREAATIATRQYAKRQRSWFRARMSGWHTHLDANNI